jgi:hypothetical protein
MARCNRTAQYVAPNGFQACPVCKIKENKQHGPVVWERCDGGSCDRPLARPERIRINPLTGQVYL